jgi:hypothetical protein
MTQNRTEESKTEQSGNVSGISSVCLIDLLNNLLAAQSIMYSACVCVSLCVCVSVCVCVCVVILVMALDT